MTLVHSYTRSGDHRWPPHVVYHRSAGVARYTLLDLPERLRQFTVTPALPPCEFYEQVPASRFPGT